MQKVESMYYKPFKNCLKIWPKYIRSNPKSMNQTPLCKISKRKGKTSNCNQDLNKLLKSNNVNADYSKSLLSHFLFIFDILVFQHQILPILLPISGKYELIYRFYVSFHRLSILKKVGRIFLCCLLSSVIFTLNNFKCWSLLRFCCLILICSSISMKHNFLPL